MLSHLADKLGKKSYHLRELLNSTRPPLFPEITEKIATDRPKALRPRGYSSIYSFRVNL